MFVTNLRIQDFTLRMPITLVTSFLPINSFKISSPASASTDSRSSFGSRLSFEPWSEGFVSVSKVQQINVNQKDKLSIILQTGSKRP